MEGLTGLLRDSLYVTAGLEEPHGLAIKEELGDYYESEIQHGRLYPNLDTLVEKGFIDKGEIDKRTNSYTLTGKGYELLERRTDWEYQYTVA